MRSRTVVFASVFVFIAIAVASEALHAQWLDNYQYRRQVNLGFISSDSLHEYQVRLPFDGAFDFGKAETGGNDICITLDDGETIVPFWTESWNFPAGIGSVWMRPPLITTGDAQFYLYYGRPGAPSYSNGISTFEAYDGFESYSSGDSPEIMNPNPGEWTRYAGNPVLVEGPSGSWDDHGATFASVIYDSLAMEFRMYYHGFSYTGVHQIGLATSPDGMNWTKYPGNPIMTPGPASWDGQSVRVPMVWKEGLTDYRMIYTGNGSGGMRVGYATSSDGISWTKHPANPVFNDPTWAAGQTENWGVMKVGSEYLMWYSNFGMRQSGIAVSTDLVTWTPYQTAPIFASSGIPSDDRYSQYCPFSFKYGDYYYVLMPSYTSVGNFSKNYLYRSSSPYFPLEDRHLVRITRTIGPDGAWDDHDGDTPFVFTLDIERTQFYNDELWCYYASEGGSDLWKMGIMIESDIASALADAPLPEPGSMWGSSGDIVVVDDPVRSGARSVRQRDLSASGATQLKASFSAMSAGRVSAWMRRASTSAGDYDIYLYSNSVLGCVAGLGRDGDFHYWNGAFQPTGAPWAVDTWYLVTILYDAGTDLYDFVVTDESFNELVRVEGIGFGNAAVTINSAMLYTSMAYVGDAFADDFRVAKWCGVEIPVVMGEEEGIPTGTDEYPLLRPCALFQNYPNPFNPTTTIRFQIAERSFVTLEIFDPKGSLVARLLAEERAPGEHAIAWTGVNDRGAKVESGIYFYRLEAGGVAQTRKLVLLR